MENAFLFLHRDENIFKTHFAQCKSLIIGKFQRSHFDFS